MGEKKIFYIGVREFTSKKDGKKYYQVDYVRMDGALRSKTDFISVLEFTEIEKKMKGKNLTECIGIFNVDDFDHLYLSAIK